MRSPGTHQVGTLRARARARSSLRASVAFAALTMLAASARPAASAAPSLESFSLTAGGVSNGPSGGCSSFMQSAPVAAFFGSGVGIPLDGLAACNVPGGSDDVTALTGPISTSRHLSNSWTVGAFIGTASSQAAYGDLVAAGHSDFSGSTSSTTVTGSEGFGRCNDIFTITSPSVAAGQAGTVKILVTVTGGLSTTGNGGAYVELNYAINGSPSHYSMFNAQVYGAATIPSLHSIDGLGLGGFNPVPGSMNGSGQLSTFAHAMVFGTPMEIDFGLLANAEPGATSTVDSHFHAVVSGIEVTGPLGQVIPNFVVTTGSGAVYGPGGVTAVAGPSRDGAGGELAAFPNPAALGTRLRFSVPRPGAARLEIFDSAGRRVRQLLDDPDGSGAGRVAWWNGRDDRGTALPSGAYFARLSWDGGSRTTRVTLVR
jgi:hypothetical protein